MNISEFRERFRETGTPLTEQGFEFHESKWVLDTDSYKLIYDAHTDKFGRTFQVRYLSLGLCHRGIEQFIREDNAYSQRAADICVLHISPSRLRALSRSIFTRTAWRYVADISSPRYFENSIDSVYYGGADRNCLKDVGAPRKDHQRALLESLSVRGIANLEESHCVNTLRTAASHIAKYGQAWASSMTPLRTREQLKRHGDNWWIANEWIALYDAAADAGFVSLR